jgi:hypothetical protein
VLFKVKSIGGVGRALAASLALVSLSAVAAPPRDVRQTRAAEDSAARVDDVRLFVPPVPPFRRAATSPSKTTRRAPRLTLLSSRPNNITDDDTWLERNELTLPWAAVPEAPSPSLNGRLRALPPNAPLSFRGHRLLTAIPQGRTVLLFYGREVPDSRYLIAMDAASGRFRYGFDFGNYAYPPDYLPRERRFIYQRIVWAVEEGDTLYVSHSHLTYARSSKGMDAYLTALDTRSGRVLWRSRPLVSNSWNFEVVGDFIVSGYGFTAQPDYLYLLDKRTGAVARRMRLKSAAGYIISKGDRLHVRAYDTDLVLKLG